MRDALGGFTYFVYDSVGNQREVRDPLQQEVTGSVAEGVVDLLEVVQVDQQQRSCRRRGSSDRLTRALLQQQAVGEDAARQPWARWRLAVAGPLQSAA